MLATRVRTRTYSTVSLGPLSYLAIGLIIAISQGYWNVTEWDGADMPPVRPPASSAVRHGPI